jgi:hypothetical protein
VVFKPEESGEEHCFESGCLAAPRRDGGVKRERQ